jgi:Peptidase family S41
VAGALTRNLRLAACAVALLLGGCAALPFGDWPARAARELEAVRQAIADAHPGPIDDANPAFRQWFEAGYEEARALLPRVDGADAMLALVRRYTSGFRDVHVRVLEAQRGEHFPRINGIALRWRGDAVVVAARAADWPVPLPPPGARLIECDGIDAAALLRGRFATWVDRRTGEAVDAALARAFLDQPLPGDEPRRCRFALPPGAAAAEAAFELRYREVEPAERARLLQAGGGPRRRANGQRLVEPGVLWVQAADFLPQDAAQTRALEATLDALRNVSGVHTIVFDLRGNGGGNTSVGARLFDAATGGLRIQRPRAFATGTFPHALWRVSALSIQTARGHVDEAARLYGPDSDAVRRASSLLDLLQHARDAGQPWVRQPAGELLDREALVERGATLWRFSGTLAVVTDAHCASACFAFADFVRRIPGARHLGRTTSADTRYDDVGFATLPSGHRLMVPLKVWRDRGRIDNEPLVPDVPLGGDIDDDAVTIPAVLSALRTGAQRG